ncbi:uncharacterized protein A4U43_C03F11760 [Asparagus officinalis]|uniref:Bromo domain-containing protein n=1 Tax=Asparagus officinalis TaxID=4686 RepID=A0A5P1FDJ2_ASPOF|nr:uncharacterized protein LOC109833494 isoform X2 [Asparagus officinalis]ONK74949.1 uncharacterized protein A4U43_C03F11760 [Asparagus officinalis]
MPKIDELEEILDKLQKKDTYKVFAEPVDPHELPDYHDVIEHPMDFGTVRRKLLSEKYRTFEQFEDDVFLICSNAMQYNAPDTIYFRQARSIEDMARRNFQEIRADLMSKRAERKSESSRDKNTMRKLQTGIASRPSNFDISSSEKKTLRQPYRNTVESPAFDIPSMETKSLKKKYRTALEPPGPVAPPSEKKILKKPQHRTADEPPGSGVSSMERSERKILKKPQHRTALEMRGSDVSSLEKKTIKKSQFRTAPEPRSSVFSSMEKRTLRKTQCRTAPELLDSDITPREKMKLKKLRCKTEPEPYCSDLSSQENEQQEEHLNRRTPEPFGSDVSSGATLASAAEAFTELSKIHANGNAPAAEPCTEVTKIQSSEAAMEVEEDTELITIKGGSIEGSNGSAGGSSCLNESKSDKADEVPAKSSPSKLGMKPCVVDVNRRATYNTLDEQSVAGTDSIFDVFEGETKQLVDVGLNSEYSYARSLSRFASCLGPIGWEIASKKIQQILPPGVKFGPGWVGEYESCSTPILSLEKNNQQQQQQKLVLTRKGKGTEIKSETCSAVWRKDNRNKSMAKTTKNSQHKDTAFGLPSQMTTVMPSNRTSSSSSEQRDRTQEQKQGLFGVNLELKPCTSRTTQQQQQQQKKNQQAGNVAKAYTNGRAEQRVDICSEASVSTSPAVISRGWNPVQTETHKLQQTQMKPPASDLARAYANETAGHRVDICFDGTKSTTTAIIPRGWNPVQTEGQKLEQPKNPVAQVQKTFTNETDRNQPDLYPKSQTFNFPAVNLMGRSQVQTEPLKKQPETAQRRNDGLVMNVGGLNNWITSDGSIPSGAISNHQAGVQYWFARGNQEQATSDPLRWMSSSVKNSDHLNTPNRATTNLQGSIPSVQVPKRENPNAAAAQAWMSVGGIPNKQAGSAPFSPTWKTPAPASRVHEEATIKQENSQVQTKGLVIFPQLMTTDLSKLRSPWQGVVQQNKQKDTLPPDLNISFQPPASPARSSSGIHIDSQQPDLALQL